MARESLQTTDIVIGNENNKISQDAQGNMLFQDTYTPPVRLSGLVGGEIVVDPAMLILIEVADWVAQAPDVDGRVFYRVTINHMWGLEDDLDTENLFEIGVDVNTWNASNEKITLNRVWTDPNNVYLESTRAIEVKAAVKRIN